MIAATYSPVNKFSLSLSFSIFLSLYVESYDFLTSLDKF